MLLSQHPKIMVFEQILNYVAQSEQELRQLENMPTQRETNTVYVKHLLESIENKIKCLTKKPVHLDYSENMLYLSFDHEVINTLDDFKKVIFAQIRGGNIAFNLTA